MGRERGRFNRCLQGGPVQIRQGGSGDGKDRLRRSSSRPEGRVTCIGREITVPGTKITLARVPGPEDRRGEASSASKRDCHPAPQAGMASICWFLIPEGGAPRSGAWSGLPRALVRWDGSIFTPKASFSSPTTAPDSLPPSPEVSYSEGLPGESRGHSRVRLAQLLREGMRTGGERMWADRVQVVRRTKKNAWLAIEIRQGKYHQIRRMCEGIGHPVLKLRRIRLGPIHLGPLPRGRWRWLKPEEVERLKALVMASGETRAGKKDTWND